MFIDVLMTLQDRRTRRPLEWGEHAAVLVVALVGATSGLPLHGHERRARVRIGGAPDSHRRLPGTGWTQKSSPVPWSVIGAGTAYMCLRVPCCDEPLLLGGDVRLIRN